MRTADLRAASAQYPADREAEVVLRDGTTVHVRPVRADDGPAIRAFLEGVSPESIGFRFFGAPNIDWTTRWAVDVDYADRFGLVVESGTPRAIVAHAVYVRAGASRAEVAFLVTDTWQGRGIATILLAHLAEVAHQQGISTFFAEVLPYNHRMIDVFRESGFPVEVRSLPDVLELELPTSLSPAAIERFEERERTAAVAAVRSVVAPQSVAVIGASRRRGTIGGEMLHNLITGGFKGPVYPVNPQRSGDPVSPRLPLGLRHSRAGRAGGGRGAGRRVWSRSPATAPPPACAALVVISAGFAEAGAEGVARQRELVEVCRDAGIRLVGPNCLGVLNTATEVRLNATFAPPVASRGKCRLHVPERRVGDRDHRGRRSARSRPVVVRLGGQQGRPVGQRLPPVLGAGSRHRPGLLYLESFGNRRSSRGSPGASRRASRSSPSRAAARLPGPARPPRTPARCCPPPT